LNSVNKKILYLVTEDWYFCSHRLPLARAARDAGYEVVVVTRVNKYGRVIVEEGMKVIDMDFKRRIKSPFKNIGIIKKIYNIYSTEKPDVVHHISLKTVVLGSIAAMIARVPVVINTLTGLGFIFTSNTLLVRLIKILFIEPVLKLLFTRKNTWTILQNIDDRRHLRSFDILSEERTKLIKGSGVDITLFKKVPETNDRPKVVFASRMLKDKGIEEFVTAARELKDKGLDASFILVGDVDEGNPSSITEDQLKEWHDEGFLEWWGYRSDMNKVFEKAHIVCLPSHREGLPKVLLEAAAAGRPVIASDVPGCREIVHDGVNGLLVPVKDPDALADAIEKLVGDKNLREKMGANGRTMAETEFSTEIINSQTLDLYDQVLKEVA
jgi:glycosyltransferase involved in cell wall biosynthesis